MMYDSTATYHCEGCERDVTINLSYAESWMFSCPCGSPLMGKLIGEITFAARAEPTG